MINLFFTFLMSILFLNSLLSQFLNVPISSQNSPHELTIAINPQNTNQVVAGSNIVFIGADTSNSGYYYSTNSGLNWSGGHISSTLVIPSGDPVIIVDNSGFFYYLMNATTKTIPRVGSIFCSKSTNGGANWSNGNYISYDTASFQDKPWGCIDITSGIHSNNIYVTWTRFSKYGYQATYFDSSVIMFARSTNGGANWSNSMRISKLKGDAKDSSDTMEGAVPCVGPNGEIYVTWSGPKILNQQQGIFFDKSTDGGNTWLENDIYVTDQPGGWYIIIPNVMRANGFPVICCDVSNSSYRGNIYINWSDNRNGINDNDIWLIKSTNGGLNWSSVKRVNNDPPGKHQFFNWMTLDQATGYLYIVFYDKRNTLQYYADVYVARSTDGGETFQNVKVNTNLILTIFMTWDYMGITSHNNKIRPIWLGTVGTIPTAFTAIIDSFYSIGVTNISYEVPEKFSIEQNYPNPFNPQTKIKFDVPSNVRGQTSNLSKLSLRKAGVKLIIYDLLGREVTTLVNEELKPGTYEADWDGSNFSSGVYFYKLVAGDFTETKKMVLMK